MKSWAHPSCMVGERTYVLQVVHGGLLMPLLGEPLKGARHCTFNTSKVSILDFGQVSFMILAGEVACPMSQFLRGAAGCVTTDFTWKLSASLLAYSISS